jgi:hypothetical protein
VEIVEVTDEQYRQIIPNPYFLFGLSDFSELNKDKVERIQYLLFKDGKYRLGLTAGIKEKSLYSPFSAPFGGFFFLNNDIKIGYIDNAICLLKEWACQKDLSLINITLPPLIYHESFIAKLSNSLFRNGFENSEMDLNYAFNLNKFGEDYSKGIWRNARKNLKIAFSNNLIFKQCISSEEKKLAYNTIVINRTTRGFPLRMSWTHIENTIKLIPADFFIVTNDDKLAIASAIVFHVSERIVQIIYWGDIPEFSDLKTMNFLAYKIFEFYKNKNVQFVDIGPSTENSIPNYGLCEFKESIGCDVELKLEFSIKL